MSIVLAVDEHNVLNTLKRELLGELEVDAVAAPKAALARCQDVSFDLAVANDLMPDMDGIVLLEE